MSSAPAIPDLDADANVSIDIDGLDCYRAIHGLEATGADGPDPVWTVGVERALALLAKCDLEATFFVVGRDLEVAAHRRLARRIVESGHEIANHSMEHPYDLPDLPGAELAYQIEGADRIIADVTGTEPVGFRAPGYNVDADVVAFSRRAGHRYDASIFPCISYWLAKAAVMRWRRLRGTPSGSAETDPRNLSAPRQPYFPDALECWRASASPTRFVEIPVSTVAARTLPLVGTALHLLDTAGFERIWPMIERSLPRFVSLELHALDFVDASDIEGAEGAGELLDRQPDLQVPWSRKRDRYRRVFDAIRSRRTPATLADATASLSS